MQNKSAIWVFTILLALACLYQISFSWVTSGVEDEAAEQGQYSLDSVRSSILPETLTFFEEDSVLQYYTNKYLKTQEQVEVYPIFGYTYQECKEKEINLGLDLQGGMNVTLEVSIPELIANLAANQDNAEFNAAIAEARTRQRDSDQDFISLFEEVWNEKYASKKLAAIFHSRDTKEKFPRDASNEQIINTLRQDAQDAIDNTEKILRTRIDKFGVTQPTIQKLQYSGRISIELPGVKDKDRVRRVLQSTAQLEFWETYNNFELAANLEEANTMLRDILYPGLLDSLENGLSSGGIPADTAGVIGDDNAVQDLFAQDDPTGPLPDSVAVEGNPLDSSDVAETPADTNDIGVEDLFGTTDSAGGNDSLATDLSNLSDEDRRKANPLYSIFQPAVFQDPQTSQLRWEEGCRLGYCLTSDTAVVNKYLNMPEIKEIFPARDMKLLWSSKANGGVMSLYAIKVTTNDGSPVLDGEVIVDARQDFAPFTGQVEVVMQMNSDGADSWARVTENNVGNAVAIVLDNYVQSAPIVNGKIPNGRSSISMGSGPRNEQIREAEDLSTVLKAGSLPAPADIVDEAVVGPSLGQKNIDSGLMSFLIALGMVLLYMIFYYAKAGIISNIALLANMFFIIGALASLQASLTLPGIAGIVLTIGMSVDANVLIYERIREEIRAGKGMRLAITDGYKRAYAAIIDANLTTLLTGIVLAIFGTGPIKGFATTLIIGIFTSLFSAIFITRLIFTWQLERKKKISFASKMTENAFTKINIGFIKKRFMYYIISGVIVVAGIVSFTTRGLNYGVDFTGGRTYVVQFESVEADVEAIKNGLSSVFISEDGKDVSTEVKTYGNSGQVKITTNYMIDNDGREIDGVIESKLSEGLTVFNPDFMITESRKVDPTISDDIKISAIWSVVFALIIIFLYIVLRFRRWQFGLGALLAMAHDVLVVLSLFSLLYGILPFSLEIDQAFIAAVLTVVGYSINDTVVVFDRIREYLGLHKKKDPKEVINNALNSTLSRTINTSLSTFIVLLMIFILGGDSIKGFVFALMVGVVVGTYSSLCIATPSMVDLSKKLLGREAQK